MTPARTTSSRRLVRYPAVVCALAAWLSACGEFPHTNPVDPGTPFTASILGPDTIYSLSDTVTFTTVTDPAWNGPIPQWTATPNLQQVMLSRFRVTATSWEPVTSIVSAQFGKHPTVRKTVVIAQRPARLEFSQLCSWADGQTDPPAGCFDSFASLGARAYAPFTAYDATGVPYTGPVTVEDVVVRSPQVLSVVSKGPPALLQARANGSTWVVWRFRSGTDSARFRVAQVPARLVLAGRCGTGSSMGEALHAGDTVRVTPTAMVDAMGAVVEGATLPRVGWFVSPSSPVRIDLRNDGFFRVLDGGESFGSYNILVIRARDLDTGAWWAECGYFVVPGTG